MFGGNNSMEKIYDSFLMYGQIRYFIANRCFNDENLKKFNKYKLRQVEFVTFDCALLEMKEISVDETLEIASDNQQILAIIMRTDTNPNEGLLHKGFDFCGYDLVEEFSNISAILNCAAGFEKSIDYSKLNEFGLISAYRDAVNTQLSLQDEYSDESHAYCEIIEIWRKLDSH